jgi:MFS superfamily sulfate permease-like transporter
VAIALSVLDHVRQEYRPKDVVLTSANSRWKPTNANPGVETEPGLIVYRFEAPLFFANADHFSARVHDLVAEAPHAVEWFLFDLVSMDDVDYTGGLALTTKIEQLQRQGTVVALANVDDVRDTLRRLGIVARVGEAYLFDTVQEAIDAFHRRRAPA